jgi:hypothetical protein
VFGLISVQGDEGGDVAEYVPPPRLPRAAEVADVIVVDNEPWKRATSRNEKECRSRSY